MSVSTTYLATTTLTVLTNRLDTMNTLLIVLVTLGVLDFVRRLIAHRAV